MALPAPARQVLRFGSFEADLASGELRKHGRKIRLQEQPFQVLALLLHHPGELVTREVLQQRLWPADTFVDFDTGLNSAVKKLRDVLGDSAESPRFIETLPRRGYRFLAAVNGPSGSVARGLRGLPEGPLFPGEMDVGRNAQGAGPLSAGPRKKTPAWPWSMRAWRVAS
jgi:DNA-binding winged helix-turn-helix (wHTH) protein